MTTPTVNAERLRRDLEALATFSAPSPEGGVTRLAWSEEFFAAERWLAGRFREAGLSVHFDAARNMWAKWEEGLLPAVVTGSHIDSVPSGGAFDGCLGVLGALEAIRALQEADYRPQRQIWVVAWMEEEGSAFGNGLFGSRALSGDLDVEAAFRRVNAQGETLLDAMKRAGDRDPDVTDMPDALSEVAAYLELHIEQGPVLEQKQIPIGIVSGIVGLRNARLGFRGRAGHAGTSPMDSRHDAGVGMARAVVEVRELARARGVHATVGQVDLLPGASNVIPGYASMTLDFRHSDGPTLDGYAEALLAAARRIADEENLEFTFDDAYSVAPVPMNRGMQEISASESERLGQAVTAIPSWAGHDAMSMARHVPTGMIFVPSRDGISHAPGEFSTPEDCATGVSVLTSMLMRLSGEREPQVPLA